MKKLFKFILTAVAISTVVMSCNNDNTNSDPGPGPGPADSTDIPSNPTMVESLAKTAAGVSLKAIDITDGDFTLVMDMGIDCPSYIFDAMPRMRFLNFLMEARKTNPELTEEQYIKDRLFDKTGDGGYSMTISYENSYDESKYSVQAQMIKGIDYMVYACACTEATPALSNAGELNWLLVPLHKTKVEGDPKVDIKLEEETFANVRFSFTMNDDCYAYYALSLDKEVAEEALAEFGEENLRQLICCFTKGPEAADNDINIRPGFEAKAGQEYWALAVGLDANGTLAPNFSKNIGTIQVETPRPDAEYKVEIKNASAMTVRATFDINWAVTHAVFYRLYTVPAWESLSKKFAGDKARDLKLDFINNGANGINEAAKSNANALIWNEVCAESSNVPMRDNTDYVLVSFGNNKGTKFTDFTVLPVKTKPLSWDSANSTAIVSATVAESTKSSVKFNFTIPETATIYWDYMFEEGAKDYKTGLVMTDPKNAETLRKWLISDGIVTRPDLHAPSWTYTSLLPGKKYYHYIMAEDTNGVIGPMSITEVDTAQNIGGPNPETDIQYTVSKTSVGGYMWNVKFVINDNSLHHRYMIFDDKELTNTSPEKRIETWTDMCMGELALKSISSASLKKAVSAYSHTMVAVSIPFGWENNGEKRGPLAYLVFDPAWITSAMLPAKAYALPTYCELPASTEAKRVARR